MKHSRLVWTAFAVWATAGAATLAYACDQNKGASASSASTSGATCTAAMAAQCSAAQAASCSAHSMKGATAATASMDHCTKGMAMSAAQMQQCAKHANASNASTAMMDHCANGAAMSAAAMQQCAKRANASAASMDHCAKGAAMSAAGMQQCAKDGKTSAAAMDHCAKNGMKGAGFTVVENAPCSGQGMAGVAVQTAHADCDACEDMAHCAEEIAAAGGRAQIVPLKNGVMYVYTAESSSGVRAVQAAVVHRNERISAQSAATKAHLCDQCKALRGAMASGKLNREVVNIEGGCLALVTSNDPGIVARLHNIAGMVDGRTKS